MGKSRESALLHRENVPQILMWKGFHRGTAGQRPALEWPSATLDEGPGRCVLGAASLAFHHARLFRAETRRSAADGLYPY